MPSLSSIFLLQTMVSQWLRRVLQEQVTSTNTLRLDQLRERPHPSSPGISPCVDPSVRPAGIAPRLRRSGPSRASSRPGSYAWAPALPLRDQLALKLGNVWLELLAFKQGPTLPGYHWWLELVRQAKIAWVFLQLFGVALFQNGPFHSRSQTNTQTRKHMSEPASK